MAESSTEEVQRSQTIRRELAAIVGAQNLVGEKPERRRSDRRRKKRIEQAQRRFPEVSGEFAIDGVLPTAVISPANDEEISAILRLASEKDYVVVPAGGLTRIGMGAPPERVDVLLRTDRLNKVSHYDAGDLTLGVGAGMTISDVQKTLAANSQFLPLDPMLPDRATIGGVLATNSSGPMRSGYGGVRDYCIGIHFVTGDGAIAKGGGKVVKNVAGYDMMKLMIGSMGTLGIITSANFKVFPQPKQTATFVCDCSSLQQAVSLRDRLIASPLAPMCMELVSPRAQEYLSGPADVRDPDEYAPLAGMQKSQTWALSVRAAGSDAVLGRYRGELGSAVTRELNADIERTYWQRISDLESTIASRHRNCMVMMVSVAIEDVKAAYLAAEQSATEHNLLNACVGRANTGSLVFAFVPLGADPPSAMQFANVASSLRGRLPKGSSAVVARCPLESKSRFDVWGTSPNDLEIMRGIRNTLDAKRILNRGRYIV